MATPPDPHTDAEALSEGWRIAGPPPGGSPARRVLFAVRRLAAALLRPQETFNAAVVRRLNTLHQANEEALHRSADAAGAARATAAAGDHALEQTRRVHEAFAARERRSNDALDAVLATQRELRTAVGVLQQATHALQREVARRPDGPASSTPATGTGHAAAPAPAGGFDSHRYVGFEDQFRGDPEEIRRRLLDYPSIFAGATDVLDMGCGRGEFLALLEERGVPARGIDVNEAMVEVSRARGLRAETADALGYLEGLPDGSLGGLFSAQVVEHLEPAYLTRVLDAAFAKLRPGAPIVLETINPACWFAFFESYLRDLSHVRALHPETLQYLLVAAGFQQVEIQYRVPYPEHDKLQALPPAAGAPDALAETFNANVERLNGLLFTWLDYAAVGRRP
jgi:2-polyprenyl-3-methyl-5-hydroxy-6-metoxy-1,4-benzoquinol methylase